MHQRHLQVLIFLASCAAEPVAPPPVEVAPVAPAAPSRRVWRLAGRVGPLATKLPSPLPFDGGGALIARCAGVLPCAAERWVSEDGRSRDLLRVGAIIEGEGIRWPAAWRHLNGALADCAGDPLAIPPAGDLGGERILVEEAGKAHWLVAWSGQNRCGLGGVLRLQADGSRVDATAVTVDGLPWGAGGRERAASAR